MVIGFTYNLKPKKNIDRNSADFEYFADYDTPETIKAIKEAIIDDTFKDQITKSSYPLSGKDKIELISYRADELIYKYSANEEKLAVFSEIYYPAGWKAYIDGKESDYFRANYVLRGMIIPSGNHEIVFSFKPSSYITGNKISLASSLLLILLIAGFLVSKILIQSKSE